MGNVAFIIAAILLGAGGILTILFYAIGGQCPRCNRWTMESFRHGTMCARCGFIIIDRNNKD